ncbi:putative multidrug resistance protein NorM [Paenibacillus sp. J31TS4]|uniref:MATE family efflux transporter n=1 Tax=Paenibacillus sp. J31TS4 TaxID=2807195 RepID=UPI001B2ED16C|nr:MATE family efflux transporter [Paenibacillus sp. J31TS4]GIP39006.1 putative multidrug resistance protein NorM [Paenibacillus sp. J31TS4]
MHQTTTLAGKLRLLLVILLPILVTQLSMYAMTFFDTFMSGHASPADLAGVAIGSSLWVPVQTGLSGILFAITPVVAQLMGQQRRDKVSFTLVQALYLAAALSVVIIAAMLLCVGPVLDRMSLEPAVRSTAHGFLLALSAGILPLFVYTVLRGFIDALGQTRVSMFITILALPVNGLLNYLFIFGNWGFPRLGGVGAGVASAITYWFICLVALLVVAKVDPFSRYSFWRRRYGVSRQAWGELLRIGVPIGFAIFFETSIFAAVTLLMSEYDTFTIAAHQSAINFASFLYMVPLSISMVLTILVGYEAGAGRLRDAKQYSYLGLAGAVGMAALCALLILTMNDQVAALYTREPAVAALTKQFLLFAIFFQLSDALAAPIQGALRGYKDVNVTLIVALVSYWVVGLPSGYLLSHLTDLGPFGYWIGLITGLAAGAVGLYARLLHVQRKRSLLPAAE